jgi:hypothetical protein
MANSSASSDGSQQANLVSNENAETMFGASQAETNMVKLVDGKLTPMGDTEDDVMDEQLRNRYSSDEERSLQGFEEKTYENSDASLRGAEDVDQTRTNTSSFGFGIRADMVPPTPGTPDPNQPIPFTPDAPVPPMSPDPMPEIAPLPGQPVPAQPEIQEPGAPDRSHQIGFQYNQKNDVTGWPTARTMSFTAMIAANSADQLPITNDDMEPGEAVPGTQYDGMTAGLAGVVSDTEDEGIDNQPETGDSSHPYDVKGNKDSSYQPRERPQETAQMMSQPRETLDESGVKAQEMTEGNMDRSDTKSTDGLDRKYNDLDAINNV